MSPSAAVSLALGAAVWLLSATRPGWTATLWHLLARHRQVVLAVAGGAAALWLADPVALLALRAAPTSAGAAFLGNGVLGRLALAALLLAPLAADAKGGLPLWSRRAAAALLPVSLAVLPPAAATVLTLRGGGDVAWQVLGNTLDPCLATLAHLLLGPPPPGIGATEVDPAIVAVLYVTATAALATACLQIFITATRTAADPLANGASHAPVPRRRVSHDVLPFLISPLLGFVGYLVLTFARSSAEPAGMVAWWLTLAAFVTLRMHRAGARGQRHTLDSAAFCALLIGAVLAGFQWRWQHLVVSPEYSVPLSLDAQSYYDEALSLGRKMSAEGAGRLELFFGGSTWFREPLYVFLLQAWLSLLGPGELHAVFFSLASSLAWVVVSGVAVAALLGRPAGAVTAYLMSADSTWVRNGVVGLREEATGVFLAIAVALLWLPSTGRLRLSWLAPLSAAAAGLTRLDALPFAGFVLLWAAVAQRWSLVRLGATAALLALVLVPVFAGYARSRGEAFPASTIIATANWKEEFADRLGTPGFEEDRRVTAAEYLFSYHSPPQLAWYTTRGIFRIYAQEMFISPHYAVAGASSRFTAGLGGYLGLESPWLVPLVFFAGCAGLLARRRLWRTHWLPLALCLVGVLPPIGFIAGVPQSRLFQVRYAYMAAPFAAAILAWALCQVTFLVTRQFRVLQPARPALPAQATAR